MSQALPQDRYLFSKLDKQFRHTYFNELYQSLFKTDPKRLLGKTLVEIAPPAMPRCLLEDTLQRLNQKGFAYIPVPHQAPDGEIYWGCVDLTRRYGAAADSGMLGYEFVSYPASSELIEFFEPLYQQMVEMETANPGKPADVLELLYQRIAQSGKSYDELVHSLQNA